MIKSVCVDDYKIVKSMNELFKHINSEKYKTCFPDGMYTNAVETVYVAIGSALFEGADEIVIKANYFEWFKDGNMVRRYLGTKAPMPIPTYPEIMKFIEEYDSIMNENVEIFHTSEDLLVRLKRS